MAISAEHRSKFAALHRQWWHLHMSEKFSSGTINHKQINKQKLLFDQFWPVILFAFKRQRDYTPDYIQVLRGICMAMMKVEFCISENTRQILHLNSKNAYIHVLDKNLMHRNVK